MPEFIPTVTYRFRSVVEADTKSEAEQKLRDVLVETLTYDGDDDAPAELEQLEMQAIS